ncbi:MAG TPA: SufE family protein [Bacteroidales bacterium]|nr:SufE family protein [Bacteroidales bacterium]
MSIDKTQQEIIESFSMFEDWLDKYDYLIELGNELPEISDQFKTDEYLINGCQSKVWLNAEYKDGKVYYQADSDAIIVKGIAALLVKTLNGETPDDIINTELHFIDKIGLKQNLSPTRSNGLLAMVKKMKLFAIAYKAKN